MDAETERRLALAVAHLGWTAPRVAGFRDGFAAARPDPERTRVLDPDLGYDEANLPEDALEALGYDDGVAAARAAKESVVDLGDDPDRLLAFAKDWQSCADTLFDAADADWAYDPAGGLDVFLTVMSREEWVAWFEGEHRDAVEDGRYGYSDLLLQDVQEPVVVLLGEDGKPDVWDGWHRIGACIVKGAAGIPLLLGRPHAPAPAP